MFKPAVGRVISVGLLSQFMHDSDELQSSNQSNDVPLLLKRDSGVFIIY